MYYSNYYSTAAATNRLTQESESLKLSLAEVAYSLTPTRLITTLPITTPPSALPEDEDASSMMYSKNYTILWMYNI
jgi:hypothetical protein